MNSSKGPISPPAAPILTCSICLCDIDDFDDGMTTTVLGCSSKCAFHTDCLEGWRKRSKQTCPNCRSVMTHQFLVGRTGYTPLVSKRGSMRAPPFSPSNSRPLPSSIPTLIATTTNLVLPTGQSDSPRSRLLYRQNTSCSTVLEAPAQASSAAPSHPQDRPALTWSDLQISPAYVPYFESDVAAEPGTPNAPSPAPITRSNAGSS